MKSEEAFARNKAARDAGISTMNIFDWEEAANLIESMGATNASAGLQDDWEWTGGQIFKDGKKYFEDYTYLQSRWAIPEIQLDDGMELPCYKTVSAEDVTWAADDKWPEEERS